MVDFQRAESYNIQDLRKIMALLRAPGGCPWDMAQTHQSIRANMLEEAYEAAGAIDCMDMDNLKEELGDVLLQVVFHACMAQEAGYFTFDDVVDGICKKLIYRHPHVFGTVEARDPEGALSRASAAVFWPFSARFWASQAYRAPSGPPASTVPKTWGWR